MQFHRRLGDRPAERTSSPERWQPGSDTRSPRDSHLEHAEAVGPHRPHPRSKHSSLAMDPAHDAWVVDLAIYLLVALTRKAFPLGHPAMCALWCPSFGNRSPSQGDADDPIPVPQLKSPCLTLELSVSNLQVES